MLLLPLGHSLMKVKPVKLVSQDGDDMLSAMTLTHTGDKEELRTLGCNGGSGLQDRSPVRSLLSATSMVTRLLTSFMPHARQSWGGPCPAKPTGSSNSMPSPADLQDRERQKTFLRPSCYYIYSRDEYLNKMCYVCFKMFLLTLQH